MGDAMLGAVAFLHDVLTSRLMFAVWLVPFVLALVFAIKDKNRRLVFVALACGPFLIYFGWAMTGLWSHHEVALAFNRTAQISSVIILILLILSWNYDNS